jgi:hypothetical protein
MRIGEKRKSLILFRTSLMLMVRGILRIHEGSYGRDLRGSKLEILSDIYYSYIYKVAKSFKFDIGPAWSRDFIESAGRKNAPGPETHEESQGTPGASGPLLAPGTLLWGKSVIRSTTGNLLWTAQPEVERESKGWAHDSRPIEVIKARRPVPQIGKPKICSGDSCSTSPHSFRRLHAIPESLTITQKAPEGNGE